MPAQKCRVFVLFARGESHLVGADRNGKRHAEGREGRCHEHEWTVFEEVKPPDGQCIIPGVIDSTTNFIEHQDLVGQRIARYADLVGCEKVIAGVDCGFATFAGAPTVLPTIAWAKLGSLAEGACIASQNLRPA